MIREDAEEVLRLPFRDPSERACPGRFWLRPAEAFAMYEPERRGWSTAFELEVTE